MHRRAAIVELTPQLECADCGRSTVKRACSSILDPDFCRKTAENVQHRRGEGGLKESRHSRSTDSAMRLLCSYAAEQRTLAKCWTPTCTLAKPSCVMGRSSPCLACLPHSALCSHDFCDVKLAADWPILQHPSGALGRPEPSSLPSLLLCHVQLLPSAYLSILHGSQSGAWLIMLPRRPSVR